ncbi:ESX secretion-associated protein EspG [Mycobacteroides sp. LB1]|uniref:ESX secretion-associated protein EspG n=1 Tax=Mycobacteroides sp. LB1 TaxID=2750814 RepID=UPI0015E02458|nr:ESX secretion-associated protein EspG [Mycobacteroides sp. LB1]
MNQALRSPDAVELTVDQAWFLADTLGAGTFPWVLAITVPFRDEAQRAGFNAQRVQELTRAGVLGADGAVDPAVAGWIRTVCRPDRWLELRYVAAGSENPDVMRGIIARRQSQGRGLTVVSLRNAHLITFTVVDADDSSALAPSVVAGLRWREPARFPEFTLPTQVGAKADEQLRSGASLADVMGYLGVPPAAQPVVESAFIGARNYVEVVAGQRDNATQQTSEVGISVVDTSTGRILVSPRRADDGVWLSTFAPGTPFAIAVAVDQLMATLSDGHWFPDARLTRDFH